MENFINLVKKSSKIHPSREIDFAELTKGLFAEVANGNVNVNYHPDFPHLALFKYTQKCVIERVWNNVTLMARGLILDLKNKEVVATPFIKFWNYNEIVQGVVFFESEYTITEKVDGSLGIVFFYDKRWMAATAGSFISEQAQWAMKWMSENMPLDEIDKSNTYLFEIIYPENKIVVTYDFEGLVLLGIIDPYGLEYPYEQLEIEADYLGTRCIKQYDFDSMDAVLKNAQNLDINNEGYVIRFKNGVRLKIKGDEYVRVHKLISRVTPLAIWEALACGDNLEEIKKDLPEELEKDFDNISSILMEKFNLFVKEVEFLYDKTKHLSDKELGLYLSAKPFRDVEFKESPNYIFVVRKGRFYGALDTTSLDASALISRKKMFNTFRPTANFLEGYKPSSVVNRFIEES
jgi:RNA ligase